MEIRIRNMVLVAVGVCLVCAAAVGLELSSESRVPSPAGIAAPQGSLHALRPVSLTISSGSIGSIGQTATSRLTRGGQAATTPAGFANSGIVGFRRTTTAPHQAASTAPVETNSNAGLAASGR